MSFGFVRKISVVLGLFFVNSQLSGAFASELLFVSYDSKAAIDFSLIGEGRTLLTSKIEKNQIKRVFLKDFKDIPLNNYLLKIDFSESGEDRRFTFYIYECKNKCVVEFHIPTSPSGQKLSRSSESVSSNCSYKRNFDLTTYFKMYFNCRYIYDLFVQDRSTNFAYAGIAFDAWFGAAYQLNYRLKLQKNIPIFPPDPELEVHLKKRHENGDISEKKYSEQLETLSNMKNSIVDIVAIIDNKLINKKLEEAKKLATYYRFLASENPPTLSQKSIDIGRDDWLEGVLQRAENLNIQDIPLRDPNSG